MSTLIDKIFDILMKQQQLRKIPQVMMIISRFTLIFPNEAIEVKNILINKGSLLLPTPLVKYFAKLQISHEELLSLWFFFLVIFTITLFLDFLRQILLDHTILTISWGNEILLEINSIFFLGILIYNSLYNPGIKLSVMFRSLPYICALLLSSAIFVCLFCLTYCGDLILLYKKITVSHISNKKKVLLSLIFLIATVLIASKILTILFR